jgi:hypothetical protein
MPLAVLREHQPLKKGCGTRDTAAWLPDGKAKVFLPIGAQEMLTQNGMGVRA